MKSSNELKQACLLSVIQNLKGNDNTLTCSVYLLATLSYFDIFTVITEIGNLYITGAIEIKNFPNSLNEEITLTINHEKLKAIF